MRSSIASARATTKSATHVSGFLRSAAVNLATAGISASVMVDARMVRNLMMLFELWLIQLEKRFSLSSRSLIKGISVRISFALKSDIAI